jgi:hypothetical protein
VSFFISHRFGGDDRDPPLAALDALLYEVEEDPTDVEHVGVSVVHESGWSLSVHSGRRLILEHLDDLDLEPRHFDIGPDRTNALRLMRAAAEGDLATLNRLPWRAGYGRSERAYPEEHELDAGQGRTVRMGDVPDDSDQR